MEMRPMFRGPWSGWRVLTLRCEQFPGGIVEEKMVEYVEDDGAVTSICDETVQ